MFKILCELFNWKTEKLPKRERESFKFLKILASRGKPWIEYSRFRSEYTAKLRYQDFDVSLSYDSNWLSYELDIRDNKTFNAIYGYYVSGDSPSKEEIEFLEKEYGIFSHIDEMIDRRESELASQKHKDDMKRYEENKEKDRIATQEKKRRYLDSDQSSGNGNNSSSITQ